MKRILLSLALLLATITVASSQIRPTYKVEASVNFSNMSIHNLSSDTRWMIGYRTGVGAEFDILRGFYANPGIYILSRGTQWSSPFIEDERLIGDMTISCHILEIPLHLGYRTNIGRQMSLSMQVGPYLAYGLEGRSKFVARAKDLGNDPISEGIREAVDKINNDPSLNRSDVYKEKVLNRFDCGIGTQAAFEYSNFNVHIGFEYGLKDVSGSELPMAVHHMNGYVGVGYRF